MCCNQLADELSLEESPYLKQNDDIDSMEIVCPKDSFRGTVHMCFTFTLPQTYRVEFDLQTDHDNFFNSRQAVLELLRGLLFLLLLLLLQ